MAKDAAVAVVNGLTLKERQFLQEIRVIGSWQKAAASIGLTHRQAQGFFKNPEFKKQYDTFFDAEEIRITERELVFSSGDIVPLIDEAKTAWKDQTINDVECPQCNHKFSVVGRVADWATRFRAIELLTKATGLVKNQSSVKVEGGISVAHFELSTAQVIALQNLKSGRPVPPGVYKELKELADRHHFELPENTAPTQAIDAEFKVTEVKREAEGN